MPRYKSFSLPIGIDLAIVAVGSILWIVLTDAYYSLLALRIQGLLETFHIIDANPDSPTVWQPITLLLPLYPLAALITVIPIVVVIRRYVVKYVERALDEWSKQ